MGKKLTTAQRIKQKKPIETWTWESADGLFTYNVYRKYQKAANEAKNPYARWFCGTVSPYTYGSEELGDGYVKDIVNRATCIFREE